ncbi:LOW QUALITY PROTEIN: Proteophosphoglycan ppg4 [Rhodotorula toruloides]|nr:LOW QUALITY PROTEIN: Proteophosphoglycan ppg4 [Rhodotorula toruloides]
MLSLVAAAALAGAVSAAPLPQPDSAQPSSGGGYGHWPSNDDSPAAQPSSGGGYGHWPDDGSSDPAQPSSGGGYGHWPSDDGTSNAQPSSGGGYGHWPSDGSSSGAEPSSGGGYGHWPSDDGSSAAEPWSGGGYGHWPSEEGSSGAQPSSGGGYGHWPSNDTAPGAQPSSGGGYGHWPSNNTTSAAAQPSSGGGYGHWPNASSDAATSTVGAFATRPGATSTSATQQAAQTGQPAPGSAGKAGLSVLALGARQYAGTWGCSELAPRFYRAASPSVLLSLLPFTAHASSPGVCAGPRPGEAPNAVQRGKDRGVSASPRSRRLASLSLSLFLRSSRFLPASLQIFRLAGLAMLATTLFAAAALAHTVSAAAPPSGSDKNSLLRRQSHPLDPNDPVEGLAGILLQFGTSVLGIEMNEPCAQPCLRGWKDGVESCTNPNDEGDYKTNVKCACREDKIALLQTCANCMGGENVQTGQAFAQQCPIALKALDGSSSGASSQASRTGSLSSFSSALVASASSFKVSSAAAQTSAGASRPAATGTNTTQPAQTGEPAPGSADKTAASLLTLGAAGLAYLLV